jgi:TRAP-type C4-dicarboxylate transport system permease small subunit
MKTTDKIVQVGSICGGWILLGTAVFITLDVVLRNTLSVTIPAVYEITEELLMVFFIYLGMASARHVAVDFLVIRLPSSVRKKVEAAALAIGSIFIIGLFIGAGYKLSTSVRLAEGTECELGYPLWPARLIVMAGLGLLALVQVTAFLKEVKSGSS